MKTVHPPFDRSRLELRPLAQRVHDLDLMAILPLEFAAAIPPAMAATAAALEEAKARGAARILMMGAHVLRAGVQRYLIDLMEKGFLSGIAMNGAGVVHDFELALVGATTESVARYIRDGSFGFWEETARINDIVSQAAREGLGLGEAVGMTIAAGDFPHKDTSLLAAASRLGLPVTVHVGIGQDIVHQLPNCDGGAWGTTSYRDFLVLASQMEALEGGVVMNFGSAVMAPEVFLKALSMARNIARQQNRKIAAFTTLVCDLVDLPEDFHREAERGSAAYYFRPWKTMLVRTVADGGRSHYLRGDHRETVPALWSALNEGKRS